MAAPSSAAAARLGRFNLRDRVARAGEGTVYRAEDERGRTVAVKLLDVAGLAPAERAAAVARFVRAAKLWRRLDHPAVVRLLGAGRAGDRVFVATEWVAAPTLDALLASHGPLAPKEAIALALRLAEALGHAHERGVIHRDLTPANVFAAPDGARLGDFGLARSALAGPSATALTGSGEAVGTFAYMAPELLSDARSANPRTDVYGLGATLFHALAGRPPHAVRSLGAAVRCVLGGAPPLPERARGRGGFLGAVVARALASRPADRYAGAAELAADLGVARSFEGTS